MSDTLHQWIRQNLRGIEKVADFERPQLSP
jgi:hypothetical protein